MGGGGDLPESTIFFHRKLLTLDRSLSLVDLFTSIFMLTLREHIGILLLNLF